MSKKILLDAFYTQFEDFLTQLSKVFPEDPDFPAYLAGVHLLRRTNPSLLVKAVHEHVSPYEATIRAKNGQFFLTNDYSTHTENDSAVEQVIGTLKGYWAEMSETNQEVVWRYITLLLDLATRYIAG